MTKPLCIYHGNCADGFTAAWAVWKRFGDEFDYFAATHGNPPPDVSGRDVLFVDFSYKREVLVSMRGVRKGTARSILVLDHHKSAAEDLAHAGGNFGIDISKWTGALTWQRHMDNTVQDECEGVHDSVYCLFDMERSGAGIAWDFFHPGEERPNLINYVEDRDLWRFVLPLSREVNAFVFAHEYEFRNWDYLHAMTRDHMALQLAADRGGAIEKKHHKDVAELVAAFKRRMTIGGHEVWAANLPYTLTSDAGNLMAQGEPFAACYWDTPEGRTFSLRSTPDGLDVSEIAARYGGGGHKNASGFRLAHGVEP